MPLNPDLVGKLYDTMELPEKMTGAASSDKINVCNDIIYGSAYIIHI